MKNTRQRIVTLLISLLMAQALIGCTGRIATLPADMPLSGLPTRTPTPIPGMIEPVNPASSIAQATLDAGKNQLQDLSRRSTAASQQLSQDANAAALATQTFDQRQKIDLDYQSTVVSLNIAQADATEKAITQQTKMAVDATNAALRSEATATQSAFLMSVTQTAQAQAILDAEIQKTAQAQAALTAYPVTATYLAYNLSVTQTVQAQVFLNMQSTRTAQVIAALTAYPATATSYAVTQAALTVQEFNREQQSFENQILKPLAPIFAALVILLFILAIVLVFRRSARKSWAHGMRIIPGNARPRPLMIDAVLVDTISRNNGGTDPIEPTPVNPPKMPAENPVHVEVADAFDAPFAHWVAEAEHKLSTEGGR